MDLAAGRNQNENISCELLSGNKYINSAQFFHIVLFYHFSKNKAIKLYLYRNKLLAFMKTATGVAAFLLHAELKVRLLKRGKSQVQRFQINC